MTLGPIQKVSGHPSSLPLQAQVCQKLPDYGLVWGLVLCGVWLKFLQLEEEVVDEAWTLIMIMIMILTTIIIILT